MSGESENKEKLSIHTQKTELDVSLTETNMNYERWKQYCEMKYYQFKAQNVLLDNFQLLFLKKFDEKLTPVEKNQRDNMDKLIMCTSTIANVGSLIFIFSQLSITQKVRFNPIRDVKVCLGGIAFMFLMRGAGALFMWSRIEGTFFRLFPSLNTQFNVDYYAQNTLHPFKIFLYRNFF